MHRLIAHRGMATSRRRPFSLKSWSSRLRARQLGSTGLFLSLALASPLLAAQTAPKRLSDWLLEQPLSANAYHLGLSWRVADEIPTQYALRLQLLQSLSGSNKDVTASTQAILQLREWVASLPVTGRVRVSVADARWLQANPLRDPILQSGHSVVLPSRPSTVTVITDNGTRCAVTHKSGHEARAYLDACSANGVSTADWAWIAQPDGNVQRFGVATWNREAQDEPAPGAWIWGPPRNSGWTELFAQQLITFLATQGPAPDPTPTPPSYPKRVARPPRSQPPPGGAAQGYRITDPDNTGTQGDGPMQPNSDKAASAAPTALTMRSTDSKPRSRNPVVYSSNWGDVGLLETPSARMYSAGHFSIGVSRTQPYTRGNVFLQPLDWLEVGFRYSDISNRAYGPASLSGTQSDKDKSLDFKVRLWSESAYVPQIALGMRDVGGTGLFSSEYLVASKRTEALDFSFGLAWGYLAGKSRSNMNVGQGGNFGYDHYFRGGAKPFGGVQYQTPLEKVALKLEYDPNNYKNEPQANNQKRSAPWNFGVVYKAAKSVDITLGVQRGNTLTLGLALHAQLDGMSTPKVSDPPRVPVAETRPAQPKLDWASTAQAVKTQTDWQVRSIEGYKRELHLKLDDATAPYMRDRVDKIAAVLHRDAPPSIDRFVIKYRERGNDMAEHVVDRESWVKQQTQTLPPSEQQIPVIARAPVRVEPDAVLHSNPRPKFETDFRLGLTHSIGGPDAFVLYQVYAEESAKLWLRDDTWVQGSLRLRLLDNYDKFKYTGPSNLPRVRTYVREYLTTSAMTLPNLQISHVGKLSQNQHYSVYGGYLEEMFAGVGGEWLYRPFASRLAFGVDANVVKQRDFRQDLTFDDAGTQTGYKVATGHATAYWNTGWNDVLATVSVGRYLAGDSGATVRVSRMFGNGVTVGAFATKTNVSADQFGEGSFDKGIYMSIPFDALLTRSTRTIGTWQWRPLTRDGGAMLSRSVQLYDLTKLRSDRTLEIKPAPPPNETVIPANRRESWTPKTRGPEPYTRVTQKPAAAQWETSTSHEYRIIEALYRQGYRNISVNYDSSNRVTVSLANDQIKPISRAVGRAARTVLPLTPSETRGVRIIFAARTDPLVTYDFFDLDRLNRYFNGSISQSELENYVSVQYVNPAVREKNPLERLNDLDSESKPAVFSSVMPETVSVGRVASDFANAGRTAMDVNWVQPGLISAGLILASSALDRRAFDFAKDHQNDRWMTSAVKVGNALPWLGLAGAGLAALDGGNPRRSRTGFAATEAGISALLVSTGVKYAVGRSRPEDGKGNNSFHAFSSGNGDSSFPSRHTSLAWAVATPFALEYNQPWLYGVAALTNLARIGSREHWVSDTVAGSLIGYGLGRIFWESSRSNNKNDPRVMISRNGINVAWELN
jgi:membrane-associated phospholipid phosphatase